MKDCPVCGKPVDGLVCGSCGRAEAGAEGFGKPIRQLSEWGIQAEQVRKKFEAPENQPHAGQLTAQQWYNVCKFYPAAAKRCTRPKADVGEHNRLDRTSGRFGRIADTRAWAREILELHAAGRYHVMYGITSAREVLGINRAKEEDPYDAEERAAIQQEAACG